MSKHNPHIPEDWAVAPGDATDNADCLLALMTSWLTSDCANEATEPQVQTGAYLIAQLTRDLIKHDRGGEP